MSSVSKAPLEQALKDAGIEYFGAPELGTDKESRDRHKDDASMDVILQEYRVKLEKNLAVYEIVKKLARTRVSALMCYEADFRQCHRQVIEKQMDADGFKVVHLDVKKPGLA